ncbi:MAG TPA: DUF2249 domain-containing protein [Microbacterium sp.]|nr:DUF2249 domain-containing protein [Microbacterium sp.]
MAGIEIHRSREDAVDQRVTEHAGSQACACGEHDEGVPELDVQTIPHAIRHAAIFGAIESLTPGGALVISATHDPVPLLTQLEARHGDAFPAEYRQRGPERWRILIRRAAW